VGEIVMALQKTSEMERHSDWRTLDTFCQLLFGTGFTLRSILERVRTPVQPGVTTPLIVWAMTEATLQAKFSSFQQRSSVQDAWIFEPGPCGAKRRYVVLRRWVRGEWK
jgi:hypothetical protein